MKEYGRKPYLSKSYREMMTQTSNAEVWTKIIEKHSEFEKPYIHEAGEYQVMQYLHPIMPGFTPWRFDDFGGYDWGITGEPFDPYDPSTFPWEITFRCLTHPCFCANETRCVGVQCSYPILSIDFKDGCEGMRAYTVGSQVCVTAPSNPPFGCRMDITLKTPSGRIGVISRILVDECDDCCIADATMAYDYGTSAATVARENFCTVAITGDNTPFTWSVSGTGFTLDNAETVGLQNTLRADDTACGSATITVTGCDDVSVTGYVRCTTGNWNWIGGCACQGWAPCGTCDPETIEYEGKYKKGALQGCTAGGGCYTGSWTICNLTMSLTNASQMCVMEWTC